MCCSAPKSSWTTLRPGLGGVPAALLAFLLLAAVSSRGEETDPAKAKALAHRFEPVVRNVEGWTTHLDPALLSGEHEAEGARAIAMLANHLQRIAIVLPTEALAKMRTLEIWMERDHPVLKTMQYHPGRGWLVEHGHDPRLEKKVHITQVAQLWSREQMLKHPAVVLHELAHAYHDQFLSFDHPEILAAYHAAREAKIYDRVLLYNGQMVRHYGLTTQMEYFAEGTEAFFYRNDFYPFVRAELKLHDPRLHDLLAKVWAEPE